MLDDEEMPSCSKSMFRLDEGVTDVAVVEEEDEDEKPKAIGMGRDEGAGESSVVVPTGT